MTILNLTKLSGSTLTKIYNVLTPGQPAIKSFRDKKIAVQRVSDKLAETGREVRDLEGNVADDDLYLLDEGIVLVKPIVFNEQEAEFLKPGLLPGTNKHVWGGRWIRSLVTEGNPKKPGSASAIRFQLVQDAPGCRMKVTEYLDLVRDTYGKKERIGALADLEYNVKHQYWVIEDDSEGTRTED